MILSTQQHAVIGVDLGGTQIRAARVLRGQIAQHVAMPVPQTGHLDHVLASILAAIETVRTPEVAAIGIGVPGLVNQRTGTAYDIQNIAGWHSVPLVDIVRTRTGLPVSVNNDANCFVLSELYYGHATGRDNVVGLALGTGMGAGIVSNGRLHSGHDCGAGELGMLDYLDADYESYCSGAFFANHFRTPGQKLYERAQRGDAIALAAFGEFGRHLGAAIRMVAYAFAPEMVVIGGSVAQSHAFFAQAMHDSMHHNLKIGHLPQVRFSLDTRSAVLGAAALCFDHAAHAPLAQA